MPYFPPPSGGAVSIPELSSDPVAPAAGDSWVLKTDYTGQPIGLLLALTYSGYYTYQFSYRTLAATTIRTTLS